MICAVVYAFLLAAVPAYAESILFWQGSSADTQQMGMMDSTAATGWPSQRRDSSGDSGPTATEIDPPTAADAPSSSAATAYSASS